MSKQLAYVTKDEMSGKEKALHALMLVLTFGMWYPVYSIRKHSAKHNAKTYRVGEPQLMSVPVWEQTRGN